MRSGNFVELEFVVKGTFQYEMINVEHISRIMFVEGKPYIGMIGSTYTRQLSMSAFDKLGEYINLTK
nr:MAG TPA: hypothetical protein [Caudoviricetes sp.]